MADARAGDLVASARKLVTLAMVGKPKGLEPMLTHPRNPAQRRGAPGRRLGRVSCPVPVMARLLAPLEDSPRHGCTTGRPAARRWALASGLVGLLGACAPEEEELPLPPIVWEGESVRVRMDDPDIEVCGGSFEALDRHAALVRQALLLEGDEVVEYSIGDQDFVDERCNVESRACTKSTTGEVFTSIPMLEHEVVHAIRVLDPVLDLRSSAFEEGLATLFGGDRFDDESPSLDPSIILVDRELTGALEYYYAGQTMALLLERHGMDAFRGFDTQASHVNDNEAFLAAFDESKEQFVAAVENVPYCEQSQWWAPLLECDGEPITADPLTDVLALSGELDCGEADVYGPRDERMWVSRHFRLDRRTSLLGYDIDMPEDATLEIVACEGGCPERFAYIGTRYQVGSIGNGLPALEPGDYFLRMSRPVANGDGHFEVVLH